MAGDDTSGRRDSAAGGRADPSVKAAQRRCGDRASGDLRPGLHRRRHQPAGGAACHAL